MKLQDYTATEKDEVTLDCKLSKDVPVVWYHNEKEIIASKLVVMRSEGTRRSLLLKRVVQSDQGKYVCDCGTDKTSASINIEGNWKPAVLRFLTGKHSDTNDALVFEENYYFRIINPKMKFRNRKNSSLFSVH